MRSGYTLINLLNMKNILSLIIAKRLSLIALLFISLTASAQNKKETNTLLWEISGKDITKPSYLFGTYHFADKGFVDTMKIVNEKLKGADAVVGEILVLDKGIAMKLMPFMMMKDTTLDKLFTPSEYKIIADYIAKFPGYKLEMFNTMKPVVVQTIILQLTAPKTFTTTNPAIDEYFQLYANENNKKIFGLETAEDQAIVLFGSSLQRQKEMLLKYIKEEEKNNRESKNLYRYYIAQDLKKLEKLFADNQSYTVEEMENMLTNRNKKWLAKLPEMMKNQSLFIAVGAGHLIGKDGLIKGLKEAGYTVKPISTK
jgi:uncharacterized protein YbaP (TraB family)